MSEPIDADPEWRRFVATLVDILPTSPAALTPETRLIEDLGLDSLALTELLVTIIETYNPAMLSRRLEDRTWDNVTLEMVFGECRPRAATAPAAGRPDEFTV